MIWKKYGTHDFQKACEAADAPGANGDRVPHILGDDDADETERAVLSALVGRIRRVVPASGIGLR